MERCHTSRVSLTVPRRHARACVRARMLGYVRAWLRETFDHGCADADRECDGKTDKVDAFATQKKTSPFVIQGR